MPFLVEVILEIIVEYLFQIPGAALRWLCYLGKKRFKDILQETPVLNSILGIGIVILLIVVLPKII